MWQPRPLIATLGRLRQVGRPLELAATLVFIIFFVLVLKNGTATTLEHGMRGDLNLYSQAMVTPIWFQNKPSYPHGVRAVSASSESLSQKNIIRKEGMWAIEMTQPLKKMYCSSRGPEFSTLHTHKVSNNHLSLQRLWHLLLASLGTWTHMQSHRDVVYTYTWVKINFKLGSVSIRL